MHCVITWHIQLIWAWVFITRKVSYVTIFCYHLLNIFVKKGEKINMKIGIFGSISI